MFKYQQSRLEILPVAEQQFVFQADGIEKTRWHFSDAAPRPYFYPFCAAGDVSLTRMGHPGAPNHDHHRSIWFAHHKVQGIDFWSENSEARIRQQEWFCVQDGEDEAVLAVRLAWLDGHNPEPLMNQTLIIGFRFSETGGTQLELQSTFEPVASQIELQQTNFGFLAVRVAKSISAYFGGGQITNDVGLQGEPALFGQISRWVDYSGPIPDRNPFANKSDLVTAGITYFDHPTNISAPTKWHIREDGWMGASVCRERNLVIQKSEPFRLRYLLQAHQGPCQSQQAEKLASEFAERPPFVLTKSLKKHIHWEVTR